MINNVYDLARHFGVDDSGEESEIMARLDRAFYKGTYCGSHIRKGDGGVVIGTIVEGSDAEFSTFLRFPFPETEFDDAVQWLEESAYEEWIRANVEFEQE